ncbi:MAG: DEAD/DEAH box helicase family protein [Candidatus Tenebribacter mawsonii]|nr:DEAD/DEAH box helicase family protein [Candidatus Tenebribacter mawsonii]
MNESETRAELIDPILKSCGWGELADTKILREYYFTIGKIIVGGGKRKPLKADYILTYKGQKLAVIEAKSDVLDVGEGVAQAKNYAAKLHLKYAYSTNGKEIYRINMETGEEGLVDNFHTPEALWNKVFKKQNDWLDKFNQIPYEDIGGSKPIRFYQEIAVNKTLSALADKKDRILLTLATGTGKTFIAFQIAWKLFHSRWNIKWDGTRRPRILFLTDRNILADQAYNAFNAFQEDALVRIKPSEIRQKGRVPTNGSIFFTIFQTFMSGSSTSSLTNNCDQFFDEITFVENASAYMYILQCEDGSFYTGSTKNLKLRLEEHTNGSAAEYTKQHLPVKLIYYEIFDRIDFAFEREKQVQKWSRDKKTALIKGDIELLKKLSKNHSEYEPKVPEPVEGYFGEYPADYFDLIIIDECHRGGANDEGNWRGIMEYFSPAVQLGLTATPKRKHNIDTYRYFGEPVYVYSLKEGINDGFLTPFKVKRIQTTLDEYVYTSDDTIIEGEIEESKIYKEEDFNKIIEIKAREEERVKVVLSEIDQKEKTIIFCATQLHAAAIRDLINQNKESTDPNYCHRVTADDGKLGEMYLRAFQDNEKTIPTILTTSQKLSTGVDARNIRNIVFLRPINTMIEFKQIIGRGTRLFEGKYFFTIYDFVNAYHHFSDPEWDGEPLEPDPFVPKEPPGPCPVCGQIPCVCEKVPPEPCSVCGQRPCVCIKKVKIKLRNGKEREIQHMISTSFWSADGKPISAEEFLQNLYGKLPEFFKDEDELRKIWSVPSTRKSFLENLEEAGFGKEELLTLQRIINAENCDLFDVLEYVSFAIKPITREDRVKNSRSFIFAHLEAKQVDFIDFVLAKYIESGVNELDQEKLPSLLELKYHSLTDATSELGNIELIKNTFISFQKYLYSLKQA